MGLKQVFNEASALFAFGQAGGESSLGKKENCAQKQAFT